LLGKEKSEGGGESDPGGNREGVSLPVVSNLYPETFLN